MKSEWKTKQLSDIAEYVGRILHPAAAVFYSCGGEI